MNNKLAQIEIALNFAGIEFDDVVEGVVTLVKKHDKAIPLAEILKPLFEQYQEKSLDYADGYSFDMFLWENLQALGSEVYDIINDRYDDADDAMMEI